MWGDGNIGIIELVDFECPFCKLHVDNVLPDLKDRFIETGEVRYISLQYPMELIHPLAMGAGEAALCAGEQDSYWTMHEKLFTASVGLDSASIHSYAEELGLNIDEFQYCLQEGNVRENIIADRDELNEVSIQGAPTFLLGSIDGSSFSLHYKLSGISQVDVFEELIRKIKSRRRVID